MYSTSFQQQESELRKRLNAFLDELPIPIENQRDNYHRICLFVYFLTVREGEGIALKSRVASMFTLADIPCPKNLDRDFSKMKKSEMLVPHSEGYRLHRKCSGAIEEQLRVRQHNILVKDSLAELARTIKDDSERECIEEAIRCFGTRPISKRATILLSWIAGVSHLQSFVWHKKKHLTSLNSVLSRSTPKNTKRQIANREDFSELGEDLFILKLREAHIIDMNVYKQLKSQLEIRNTCGHPNSISISDSKVEAFLEDVINNILLRYKTS
jgi:hypothetical protein